MVPKKETGETSLTFPDWVRGQAHLKMLDLKPRRNEPIIGNLRDKKYEQYDFTQQQYDSLVKLAAGLCHLFPQLKPDAPRDPQGKIIDRTLTPEQWTSFSGILGHYHVQDNKIDPGPAMDWEYLLKEVRLQMKRIDAANAE